MFSWNWSATESASVVEKAVTIAVVSHARRLATAVIETVAYDTTDAVLAAPRRLFANPDGYPHSGMYDTLAHRIRRSYAADMLRCGTSLGTIRRVLGHSSITTTIVYRHVTDADLSETPSTAPSSSPTTTYRPPGPGHGSAGAQVDARKKPEPQPPKRLGFRRSQTVRPSET
jgi:hypothetical protein